uniref:Nucleoporin Nup54 alpha-helical domain-containing protein n=1 Tax=Bos indicus x Bos taurus TaxID=30522 RepID=A0A4W2H187_BOBOX
MVGFKELLRRLKVQDQMTKQHQTRLDIISEDIGELQKNQTTTMAKIAQYKRKLMDLSQRTLQVLIKQEIPRKSGYAIQADEEQLRVQLDTIQGELNAPTQFKVVKNPPANAGDLRDMGVIPGSGRSPAEEHGNPLQYSCLENPMDRGA